MSPLGGGGRNPRPHILLRPLAARAPRGERLGGAPVVRRTLALVWRFALAALWNAGGIRPNFFSVFVRLGRFSAHTLPVNTEAEVEALGSLESLIPSFFEGSAI